jgi:hypothetical protein
MMAPGRLHSPYPQNPLPGGRHSQTCNCPVIESIQLDNALFYTILALEEKNWKNETYGSQ